MKQCTAGMRCWNANTGAAGEETEEKTDSEPENESVSEVDAVNDEADCE